MKTFARPVLQSEIFKSFDKEVGMDETASVKAYIDTGYAPLNYAMTGMYDGGIPQGRLVEIFGPSSCGKTALAADLLHQSQAMGGAGGFRDWERSWSDKVAVDGYKIDLAAPYWNYKKPRTWEEGNTQTLEYCHWLRTNGVIHEEAPILIVHDSIASAIPMSVLYDKNGKERKMESHNMNDTTALARVASTTLKLMAQGAEDFNATFVYLNQIRTKPGVMFGDPTTTPGGVAMEFYSTVRLSLGRSLVKEEVKGEKGKQFIGQDVSINCVKSKLTKPFKKTAMQMRFDDNGVASFDKEASLVALLHEEKKLVAPQPGYVTWDGKRYHRETEFVELVRTAGLMPQLNALLA